MAGGRFLCHRGDLSVSGNIRMVEVAKGRAPVKSIVLLLLLCGPALAHDMPTDWIGKEKRTNAKNVSCCGKSDCHPFTVDQVKIKPDGYHFIDGEVVPFGEAAPSIDNLYWKCRWGGERKCVFAPLGAS